MSSLLKVIKEQTLSGASRKVNHEEDFHSAWKNHIRTLNDSKIATDPVQRNLLGRLSRAHLDLALLHASMYYNRHGKPIEVTGNDYDEFARVYNAPLVVKK